MLPNEYVELLSAFVDGEVSARQRRAVLRLVRKSTEARRLLREMQEDARRLRQLPRRPSEPEFELRLLNAFAEQESQAQPPPPPVPEPYSLPLWLGVAAAAAVLFAVSIGSYLFFANRSLGHRASPSVAHQVKPTPDSAGEHLPPQSPHLVEPELLARTPRSMEEPNRDPRVFANPRPVPKRELFKPVEVKGPMLVMLHDLDQDKPREQLCDELKKSKAVRLDLPCRESTSRAVKRLQAVLEGRGTGMMVDQVAQVRLNYGQAKTNYVVYLEDITMEELAGVLHQLGLEDRKQAVGHREFTELVASPMNDGDRQGLSQLLGVDPGQLQVTQSTSPFGIDPRKPLSEKTREEVLKVLTGQGGVPRPEPGKPGVKPAERLALALAYNPVRPRSDSFEVRRFLDQRKPPREGTLQVLLVLRDAV